jgi:3-oxoacyl-[acyl-carrier-protein] synthase II
VPKKRVVITGLGATTPLGGDVPATWAALLAGRSGVRRLTAAWAADLPVRIAAPAAADPAEVPGSAGGFRWKPADIRRLDRGAQLAVVVAREAWADAGLAAEPPDPESVGVVIGTAIGGLHTLLAANREPHRISALTAAMVMPNAPAANVALDLGALGAVHAPVTACAAGNEAIALAADQIRLGRADVAVAGGAESPITPLSLTGFGRITALSRRNHDPERASRPWDAARDGFVLGEGAGVLVLEAYEHARARGARIYAEFAGAGISADAHHIVQPDPSGAGAGRAMTKALHDGDLAATDIVHVNAHATATPAGDLAEARAIRRAVGDHPVVTAPKSMLGHLLGATAAIEAVATVLALHHRLVPPTINLDRPGDGIDLDIATEPRELRAAGGIAALNNAFAFGGHNVVLALTSI